jgi:hypothetical protein
VDSSDSSAKIKINKKSSDSSDKKPLATVVTEVTLLPEVKVGQKFQYGY